MWLLESVFFLFRDRSFDINVYLVNIPNIRRYSPVVCK